VFLGLGDQDPWVALDLIQDAARIFDGLGGEVDLRIYPGQGHSINQEEIDNVRKMIEAAG
jgi:predicted esterase